MGFLHPRDRAWRVTLLILLAITLIVGVIGRAVVVSLENDEQVTQVERLYRCDSLGIAGPMSWENMTIEEFQVMVQEMADIGAAWIRIGVIWRDVEPSRGNFEWDGLDQRLQLAVDAGFRPLLLIHTTPSWIDDVGEVGGVVGRRRLVQQRVGEPDGGAGAGAGLPAVAQVAVLRQGRAEKPRAPPGLS